MSLPFPFFTPKTFFSSPKGRSALIVGKSSFYVLYRACGVIRCCLHSPCGSAGVSRVRPGPSFRIKTLTFLKLTESFEKLSLSFLELTLNFETLTQSSETLIRNFLKLIGSFGTLTKTFLKLTGSFGNKTLNLGNGTPDRGGGTLSFDQFAPATNHRGASTLLLKHRPGLSRRRSDLCGPA